MSYDIDLLDPVTKEIIQFENPHHIRGGTYAINGTTKASFNITYNYSSVFYRTMGEKGIRSIYGLSGANSISILKSAINQLSDDVDSDYWTCSEGNVKRALYGLLAFAEMRPDGIWDGD
mgnify:CR=1 FL=1